MDIKCNTCKHWRGTSSSCPKDLVACFYEGKCQYFGQEGYERIYGMLKHSLWEPNHNYVDPFPTPDEVYDKDKLGVYKTMQKRTADAVNHPKHYNEYPIEVIDIIKRTLSIEQFNGYCLGNIIKYRMRAGLKDPSKVEEDIAKAEWYRKKMEGGSCK